MSEEEDNLSDEDREKKLQKLDKELNYIFDNALCDYAEHRIELLFGKSSEANAVGLYDVLKRLWVLNVRLYGFDSFSRFIQDGYFFPFIECGKLEIEQNEIKKKKLIRHGRKDNTFWFKKKHFEEFLEPFDGLLEMYIMRMDRGVLFEVILGRKLTSGISEKKEKERLKIIEEESEMFEVIEGGIKKGNEAFIKDLEEVRAELKKPLQVVLYWLGVMGHWLKVVSLYVLPWVIVALALLQVWLTLKAAKLL